MRQQKFVLAGLLAAFLGLSLFGACSIFKHKEVTPEAKPPEKTAGKGVIQPEDQPLAEANQALAAGHYAQALDIYKTWLDRQPDNKKIQAASRESLEKIKTRADQARIQGRYNLAIDSYNLLLKNYDYFSRALSDLSFSSGEVRQNLKESRLGYYLNQIDQSLKVRKYEQASNLLLEALKENPGEASLKKQAERLLTELKSSGDQSLTDRDFAQAGRYYGLAKKIWPKFKASTGGLTFKLEDLKAAIRICSQQLTNQGMLEYRKGNLKGAISVWESLLAFDPDNDQIKKAIETARAQLQQIKS